MNEFSPSTLPAISCVEVVDLREFDPPRVSDFMQLAAEAAGVRVEGMAAGRIAELWRALPLGDEDRCHFPPFGLRFITNGKIICWGTICWQCNNIWGDFQGVPFAYEFNSEAAESQALFAELECAVRELR